MKIKSIEIKNFRALSDFSIDLEDDLSVIIGKNNTGKTSLLSIMDKFLGDSKTSFDFHDFNKKHVKDNFPLNDSKEIKTEDFNHFYLSMTLHIEYNDDDYIGNLSKFFMDLNPKNKKAILSFEYLMGYEQYQTALFF